MNVMGYNWIYKASLKANGTLKRSKACLVTKGFNQVDGMNFFETFSPIMKHATIQVVLTLAIVQHWKLCQLYVKDAFFHGFLNNPIYMHQPLGCKDLSHPDHVCQLHIALYDLNRLPKLGSIGLITLSCSLASTQALQILIFSCYSSQDILLILFYVDDMIST